MGKPKSEGAKIAVVGVSALYPGSVDKHGFWRNILEGADLIQDIPDSHFLIDDYYDPDAREEDKIYTKRGGFLPDVEFDPVEFGILPSSIPSTDTSQLLALMMAKQVLEDAAEGQFAGMNKDKISVILGVAAGTELVVEMGARIQRPVWVKALRESGLPEEEVQAICDRIANHYVPWQESTFPGLLANVVAGRIANRLDLGGTNCVTDAACASSLSAISIGMMELATGQSDLVITGGVDTLNDIFMYMCFTKTPALSPTGDCRPFAADADGTIIGEGIGMLALKRLADAERDGDRIYAVIQGIGTSSDGMAKSVYAPRPEGQARAIRRAYEHAGYGPETVELMEAHGTGTKAGDAAEFEGLRAVFGESGRDDRGWCALGSVKSQIGHTKAAAGAASLFKAVMALHHKVLPPTIKIASPNPKLGIESSPFYLNTEARPWIRGSDHPRRASVSSFGFGGSNFHLTAEEYEGPGRKASRLRSMPSELIVLSASDGTKLREAALGLAGELACRVPDWRLKHAARSAQEAFDASMPCRLAVVAAGFEELQHKLAGAAERLALGSSFDDPASGIYASIGPGAANEGSRRNAGKLAIVFPGQGSQYVGMGGDLAMAFGEARAVWDLAADMPFGGEKLHERVFPQPAHDVEQKKAQAGRLTPTEWAQPALGAAGMAAYALLARLGVKADCFAGHSFGEWTALCAAGALDTRTLLLAARMRGEAMQEAAAGGEPGAMSAVMLDAAELERLLCAGTSTEGRPAAIANRNSPSQTVLSGTAAAIEEAEQELRRAGVAYRRLPVSAAFHSSLVEAAVQPFREAIRGLEWRALSAPVYSNLTAFPFSDDLADLQAGLARQIAEPVHFREMVESMIDDGVTLFIEPGPGNILTGLIGQCAKAKSANVQTIALDSKGANGIDRLWHGLGRLAAAGVEMDFAAFWQEEDPLPKRQEIAKKRMTVTINGANSGRPYPPKGGSAALPAPNPESNAGLSPSPLSIVQSDSALGSAYGEIAAAAETPFTGPVRQAPIIHSGGSSMSTPIKPQPAAQHAPAAIMPAADFAAIQKQVADTHDLYMKMMTESHMQFLRLAGSLMQSGAGAYPAPGASEWAEPGLDTGSYASAWEAAWQQSPLEYEQAPALWSVAPEAAAALQQPQAAAPRTSAVVPEPPAFPAAPSLVLAAPAASVPSPAPVQAAIAAAHAPGTVPSTYGPQGAAMKTILLEIVSEKTGYPPDMLDLEADLEAGLGIDSIKRVEIFAALEERVPGLPDVDPGLLSSLNTLASIVQFMEAEGPGGGAEGKK
ncbi:beta-ketoacyl synthase N-terminal-like domain-containing protein [Paenibacillus sp. MBLB4367]|uniref:beta-ketoacyl synthase N-terminal-like domain-containing protein n=1 Tax=Paenibacillus sp. MBLB4367 TaxID=3384767 RepID=UPI003907F735